MQRAAALAGPDAVLLMCVRHNDGPTEKRFRIGVLVLGSALRGREQILDPSGQRLHRKRLGDDLHAGLEVPVADQRIFRIARDEQDREIGPQLACHLGDLSTIYAAGQSQVGDQEVHPCIRLQDRQRGPAICRFDCDVAEIPGSFTPLPANPG
jgi:hypothetical protein